MALLRTQVFSKAPTDLPRDGTSNTVYHLANGITPIDPIDANAICEDIAELFNATGFYPGWNYDVRTYDNAAPEGTPPLARVTGTYAGGVGTLRGPREVACCLSYRTDPPYTSSRRGRIYLGPFPMSLITGERPVAALWDKILTLGEGLAGIGGENVSWRVNSPKTNENHHIRSIWVDNAWDTVRGRGQAPNARQVRSV